MIDNGEIISVSNFDEVKKKLELVAANEPIKLTSFGQTNFSLNSQISQ